MKPSRENRQERTYKRRKLRRESTRAEELLWHSIRNRKLGHKFRRQIHIEHYIVDFYCSSAKLAIELDGKIHDSEEQLVYDQERDKVLNARGVTVIRFPNSLVLDNIDGVCKVIRNKCDELI